MGVTNMSRYLESERIILREFVPEDIDHLVDLDSDPEVMKYLTGGESTSRENMIIIMKQTATFMEKYDYKLGIWAAIEKSSNKKVR